MTKTAALPKGFRLPTLPGPDARDALLAMAKIYGDLETFKFLGLVNLADSPTAEARAILAARAIKAELTLQPHLNYRRARIAVGDDYGYHGTSLSNWNKIADRGHAMLVESGEWDAPTVKTSTKAFVMPTRTGDDARDAILGLADLFGPIEAFQFLGLLHHNSSPIGEVRAVLAARNVMATMLANPAMTYQQARLATGKKFGFSGNTLMNWNSRIADRGRDLLIESGELPVQKAK